MRTSSSSSGLLRWRKRSNPERLESYIKWSMFVMPLVLIAYAVGLVTGADAHPLTVVFLASATVEAVAANMVMNRGIEIYLERSSQQPRGWSIALGLSALCCLAVELVVCVRLGNPGAALLSFAFVLGVAGAAYAPWVTARTILYVGAAATGLAMVVALLIDGDTLFTVLAVLVMVGMALVVRASVWQLGAIWEQVRLAETEARLAVAEERLRFSRDLHDVFGRTLSVVALKSEVAAALTIRGDERGVAEMREVQRLSREALAEIRALVQGYRRAELDAELAGAREFLGAAGIACRVVGSDLDLPEQAQESAAWVVREGVTNVVRHSNANQCTIEVARVDDGWRVQITNNGAAPKATSTGSGLRGLAERLRPRDGHLDTNQTGDEFTLTATLKGDS